MTVPAPTASPRWWRQRLVLVTLMTNAPVCRGSGVTVKLCCGWPLQLWTVSAVPLAPLPASRHFDEEALSTNFQALPIAVTANLVESRFADAAVVVTVAPTELIASIRIGVC